MRRHRSFFRTAGVPIPAKVSLSGREFRLREFVIAHALTAEDRKLNPAEEKEIIDVIHRLKEEYSGCLDDPSTQGCPGILRAVHILLNLLQRHPIPEYRKDIEDLKRWLEFGRRL